LLTLKLSQAAPVPKKSKAKKQEVAENGSIITAGNMVKCSAEFCTSTFRQSNKYVVRATIGQEKYPLHVH
jgi:hypothetical protein